MILVVNATGLSWTGLGWSEQGKEFLSIQSATRSLQEEGEDVDHVNYVESEQ
jgi:hypothetical protein